MEPIRVWESSRFGREIRRTGTKRTRKYEFWTLDSWKKVPKGVPTDLIWGYAGTITGSDSLLGSIKAITKQLWSKMGRWVRFDMVATLWWCTLKGPSGNETECGVLYRCVKVNLKLRNPPWLGSEGYFDVQTLPLNQFVAGVVQKCHQSFGEMVPLLAWSSAWSSAAKNETQNGCVWSCLRSWTSLFVEDDMIWAVSAKVSSIF